MATTPCPDDRDLLPAALDQAVPDRLRAHLDACPACARRVARLRAEVRALRSPHSTVVHAGPPEADGSTRTGPEPVRAPPVATPAAVGKYPVVGRLGGGGQGEVYRAVHPELRQDLVIKLARRPLGPGGIDGDLLAAEGRVLADLRHDNLVRVYDLGVHEGRAFLAMEFVRGCTLEQHAGERRLSPRRAAALVAEVARAVGYLHGRGVVHQDLTPRNVLVDESGRPRLIDFGLARLRDAWADQADGPSGGTLAYMAPEQARGEVANLGPHSDVFALGAVLYFLLTGGPPFVGRDTAEVWDRARRGDFDRAALNAAGVPRRLERICLKAMAREPQARYRSAAELEAALRRGRAARPIAIAAIACLLLVPGLRAGMLVWNWLSPTPPAAASPVLIVRFDLEHLADRSGEEVDVGKLGEQSFAVRPGDDVTVDAELSEPAYSYLIAFRPDGVDEVFQPEDAETAPRKTPRPCYPPESEPRLAYRLSEGTGLHAFALVVSRTPLPSFRQWKGRHGTPPWQKGLSAAPGVVWSYDGRRLHPRTGDDRRGQRSAGATIRGSGSPIAELAAWLKGIPGVDDVAIKAFRVPPASGP
jgi:serine/threonine protein kinase